MHKPTLSPNRAERRPSPDSSEIGPIVTMREVTEFESDESPTGYGNTEAMELKKKKNLRKENHTGRRIKDVLKVN